MLYLVSTVLNSKNVAKIIYLFSYHLVPVVLNNWNNLKKGFYEFIRS